MQNLTRATVRTMTKMDDFCILDNDIKALGTVA